MTIRTESRITVARGVGEVWAYVCDVGRWPEWAPTVLECHVRGGGPLRVGATIEQRARDWGWTHRRSEEVTVVEPPWSVAFAGPMGTSPARWAFELEPADGGATGLLMWVEVDPAGMMRAVPGLLRGSLQRVSDTEMWGIRSAIERDTDGQG